MKPSSLLTIAVLLLYALPGCNKPGNEEAEMKTAIELARSGVDTAIQKLQSGEIDNFSVKVPVKDDDRTEDLWLNQVVFENDSFSGIIDDVPETVKIVKVGDRITAKKEEISDWFYIKDDKIHGNYTLRAKIKNMPRDEAAKFKRTLAE